MKITYNSFTFSQNSQLFSFQKRFFKISLGVKSLWRPEYAGFMIEASPGQPYGGLFSYINMVEANMKYRRQEISELLHNDEIAMTLTAFPRLGTANFTWPIYKPKPQNEDGISGSMYIPDELISLDYPRFATLTQNIRKRRGENVNINLPIFKDVNTNIPVSGASIDKPDAVHMDTTGFGSSCCCLQLTFQVY